MSVLHAQLKWADRGCSCESYYKFTCFRCRQSAEGKAPDLEDAVKLGYVTWKGYGAPKLTASGKTKLQKYGS